MDGRRLEGVGVEPDHVVESELAWAAGRDAIFEKGLGVALDQLAQAGR